MNQFFQVVYTKKEEQSGGKSLVSLGYITLENNGYTDFIAKLA